MSMKTPKTFRRFTGLAVAGAIGALAMAGGATPASADVDPPGCSAFGPSDYDPSIRTFKQVTGFDLGGGVGTNNTVRRPTPDLYTYLDALVADTTSSSRVKVVKRSAGTTWLGRDIPYVVVGTPENINNLDSGRNDAAFWRGVRTGGVDEQDALDSITGSNGQEKRPAFVWLTGNVHGDEPAGAEGVIRTAYELAARQDCANVRRLDNLTTFLMPSQNPDGRDANLSPGATAPQRTNAWGFDLNRDWGTLTQKENLLKINDGIKYPPIVYVDAHQQGGSSYFFPPNEDPVHHEVSDAAIDAINQVYGPALQQRFNDQGVTYQNYNAYDLFVPEYGDTVPALLFGAAGMTYEKGNGGSYGKQVYDHYLALDETINVSSQRRNTLLREWILQWDEAEQQGAVGDLEPNQLVSPIHGPGDIIPGSDPVDGVFGYYYLPNNHDGDAARLVTRLLETGVHAYKLTAPTEVDGVHEFGPAGSTDNVTLPAGTMWIPMDQRLKHWIQSLLGEDPFIPFNFCYDRCAYSFSLLRGMSDNGILTQAMPEAAPLTEITDPDLGTSPAANTYYAFSTDSSSGLSLLIHTLSDGDGATAWRAEDAFDAAGRHFPTGAAIVDGSTITPAEMASLSDDWQTPVTGLSTLPAVNRFAMAEPKFALYTAASNQINPLASPTPGRCAGSYCTSLFVLTQKLGIPYNDITLVSNTQLASSPTFLTDQGFTAFINPTENIAAGAGTTDIQNYVNNGGRYVSWNGNGATTARNAGITNLNTQAVAGLQTNGIPFNGSFNTDNPVAWGFDNGGFIYRSASGDATWNPATLTGDVTPPIVPDATAAVSYADPLKAFGFSVNATGPGQLPGRPAVIDQPFGSGHAVILGFDAMFRAWVDSGERMLLNGALYPTGAAIPPGPKKAGDAPANPPIPEGDLPPVANRPVAAGPDTDDLVIQVDPSDGAALRKAIAKAGAPKGSLTVTSGVLTYRVRNAAVIDTQDSAKPWAEKIMRKLNRRGTPLVSAHL